MADDVEYRSFEPELEVVRGAGDGRTVIGVAVPYGKAQRINDQLTEQFAAGAFRRQEGSAHRIAFARDHLQLGGTLIGRLDTMRDSTSGLRFEARVAKTAAGDDTLALIECGALRENSVGFRPRQNRTLPDGTVERVTAELREVAVVLEGAYGRGATIGQVRAGDQGGAGGPGSGPGGDAAEHQPPKGAVANAQKALDAIKAGKGGPGLTDVGRARAAQLAAGKAVSLSVVRAMNAYFARHDGDKGRDQEGTPAWVAWMAWGGDAARSWAAGIVKAQDGGTRSALHVCGECGHPQDLGEHGEARARATLRETEALLSALPERLPL